MKVILSIKLEYANKIFEGTKKYEFRKAIYKTSNVKKGLFILHPPFKRYEVNLCI